MPENKSPGDDGITMGIIKENSQIITPIIVDIVNKCFEKGVFPETLKNSIITPIYKTGDRKNPGNYRPIAILNSFSKIIEKTINNRIIKFIDGKNKILNDNQYAYRKERSIQDVLYELIEEINNNLENNYVTATLFLDIKKAFDSVNHEILLKEMNRIGIRGKGGELMKHFLLNSTQEVKVNNSLISDKKNLKSGVPQGSTLGTTMFIIYTNDLEKREDNDGITLKFADDTATSKGGKNIKKQLTNSKQNNGNR